ncbi:MAG: ATP-binding protein [Gammaproteobacteria bacterium]|nr:ATP-binding protein [Gammaproteobacteria bacterium]MCZ6772659.1 ATP-binding protein [Pseudomonadota bacterium]
MFKVKTILEEKKSRLVTVPIDATVGEAVLLMKEENIGALMVVDANGSLLGILSERDLVYGLEGADASYLEIPVASLMSCDVQTCDPDDSIYHVAKIMGTFRIRHLPVLNGAGLMGMISIRDVEDFRNKELDLKIEQLLDSNEGYTRFLQKCPDAIYIQVDDKIVFANSKSNEIFGAKFGNHLIGVAALELFHPDSRDFARARCRNSRSVAGSIPLVECRRLRLDGSEFHGESAATSINWNGQNAILCVVRNVDQRRDLELRLRESERMNALGQLAGGIAHDFNNLMMVISGFTERALGASQDSERVEAALGEVVTAAEKAAKLTKQLLMFSRRQVMESSVFRVASVVRDLEPLLSPLLGETIELTVDIVDEAACVETDINELTQALMNLATNARDAMPHGGALRISVTVDDSKMCSEDGSPGQRPESTDHGRVVISVQDDGHGMDPQTASRVFEPFFTTKEQGKGTGLGMAMVYGFVQQSGGTIDVQSAPGQGTTVTIVMPRVVAEPQIEFTPAQRVSLSARGETILLAEDDDALRRLAQATLEELGYTVLTACNGLDALEIEDEFDGEIDLLLSDVVMPGLNGFDLLHSIKITRPDIKVVLMSGYPARGDLQLIFPPKDVQVLQKPLDPNTLALNIRNILDQDVSAQTAHHRARLVG